MGSDLCQQQGHRPAGKCLCASLQLQVCHLLLAACVLLFRYIAVEFAGIFQGLGAQVHLMYRADKPLRG
jgi:glutathione reductase (NADPH)